MDSGFVVPDPSPPVTARILTRSSHHQEAERPPRHRSARTQDYPQPHCQQQQGQGSRSRHEDKGATHSKKIRMRAIPVPAEERSEFKTTGSPETQIRRVGVLVVVACLRWRSSRPEAEARAQTAPLASGGVVGGGFLPTNSQCIN